MGRRRRAEVLCVYGEVQVLKKAAAKSNKLAKPVAIVSCDESREFRTSQRRRRIPGLLLGPLTVTVTVFFLELWRIRVRQRVPAT